MEQSYKRSKGNAGIEGVQFQINLLTVFLLNALRNLKGWKISTENEAAGKFDDAIIEFSDGSAVLLQAKHKDSRRIIIDQLLSDNSKNSDFSLPKYFLSHQEIKYKFNIKNIIICTNADFDKRQLKDIVSTQSASSDNILHYEGENCCFVKFNENILDHLKKNAQTYYDNNWQGKKGANILIEDEHLKDFLGKFQFFSGYPSGINLNKVIERLLSRLNGFRTSAQEINKKVEDWFKQGRGEYLTEARAHAMFCEIKSDKLCKTLKDYNVLFERNELDFASGAKIFFINSEGGYLLQALKIHDALRDKKALYFNSDDGVEFFKQVAEAFELPRYHFLVLILQQIQNSRLILTSITKLKDLLDKYTYKKVILISPKRFVQQTSVKDYIFEVSGSITFKNFTRQCYKKLIRKKNILFQEENITLEKLLEDNYPNVNSEIIEKLVIDEKIRVGSPTLGLDSNIAWSYINRIFEREIDEIGNKIIGTVKRKETFTEEDIFNGKEKAIIISDSAGMGKTTVLTNLSINMKNRYNLKWIIRIELNEYSKFLRDCLKKNKRNITLIELLNSNSTTKLTNELEEHVFSMREKLVLMLDGFDEISPDYTNLVLNLLEQCYKAPNFAKIVITTRPHLSQELQEVLQVKPFILQPFTINDQITFLTKYWERNLELDCSNKDRCEKYATTLLNKISFWLKASNNFAAIPLQLRMIAEIFQEHFNWNDSIEWVGCKEFLEGDEEIPTLPKRMKVTRLYDMFIDKKLDIFLDKANPSATTAFNHLYQSQFNRYFRNHQSLALKVVLGSHTINDERLQNAFSSFRYDKSTEAELLQIGIIQEANGELEFVHRTFAEYFAAKSIFELSELYNHSFNQDVNFQMFFIDKILYHPQLTVLRAFIENFIEDIVDDLPSNIFENYKNFSSVSPDFQRYQPVLIHMLASEGCLSVLRVILKCISFNIREFEDTVDKDNTLHFFQRIIEKSGINFQDPRGYTPLHYASSYGHLDMVSYLVGRENRKEANTLNVSLANDTKFLMTHYVDVNVAENEGFTAFHLAAREGHLDVMRILIEHGAHINVENKGKMTPLHSAVGRGHIDIVKFLIERGLDSNQGNDMGLTALHGACIAGHLDIVKFLKESGADIRILCNNGITVLSWATWGCNLDVMNYLMDQGLDINEGNATGYNPLLLSVLQNRFDCVKNVLNCGADITACESKGFSALHLAAQYDQISIAKLLIERGLDVNVVNNKSLTPLHSASLEGHLEIVKLLVDSGAHIEAKDHEGFTALHYAAECGHEDVIKFFIEHGLDVNVASNDKTLALHSASKGGHLSVVKLLINNGALIDAGDDKGTTALYLSSASGNLDITEFLVHHGAKINITQNKDFTPLHAASVMGDPHIAKFLLEHNADVNAVSKEGTTPMLVDKGNLDIIKLLRQYGADVNVAIIDDQTPLHRAAKQGQLDIVKYLVECGAHTTARCECGFTAFQMAIQRGHLDVVKYLIEVAGDEVSINTEDFIALNAASVRGHVDIVKFLLELNPEVCHEYGSTSLYLAVKEDHLEVVKILLEHNVDVNVRHENGDTSLHLAAKEGHLDVVMFLIEHGADAHLVNSNHMRALHLASVKGHLEIVKFLFQYEDGDRAEDVTALHFASTVGELVIVKFFLESKVDVNVRCKDGSTSLHVASGVGHLDIVRCLIEFGADVDLRENNSFTALHSASARGHLDIVKFLLDHNADINACNKMGITSLHLAAEAGHLDIVRFLIKHGGDVTLVNSDGLTTLHKASGRGHLDNVKFLREYSNVDVNARVKNGNTSLHLASEKGHLDVVKFLVKHGADITLVNDDGYNALHSASRGSQLDIVKFLLELNVDVNARDKGGFTALYLAAGDGHLEVVRFLIEHGGDAYIASNHGYIALHPACLRGHLNIVKYFFDQYNIDVNVCNNDSITSLHLSAKEGHLDVVKFLIERGADAGLVCCEDFFTPLQLASMKGHLEIVKFLLECNGDINKYDGKGNTSLHMAAEGGHLDVVKLLVNAGADVNINNHDGVNPLQVAAENGHLSVVEFLTNSLDA